MLGLNDTIGNDLPDSFNSHRLHHHRRSLKTVLRVHRLTIVPQHYRHLHIGHLLSRVPMYPGAGDHHTRWSHTGHWLVPIRLQLLGVDLWSADRHRPTSSPRMQTDVYYCRSSASRGGKLLASTPLSLFRGFFVFALGPNAFSNAA